MSRGPGVGSGTSSIGTCRIPRNTPARMGLLLGAGAAQANASVHRGLACDPIAPVASSTVQHRRLSEAQTGQLLDDLSALLGADRVLTGIDVREQHGVDESFHPIAAPDAVVYPTSTEEAAAIVGVCARHNAPIVPFGAGTSLEGHVQALQGGVSVDMREMNRILRLSIEDLDVSVQAGVTRKQLDAA